MLRLWVCLLHTWTLLAVIGQITALKSRSTTEEAFANTVAEIRQPKVQLYPIHKAAALRATALDQSVLPAGGKTEHSSFEVKRCRAAECVPDVSQLRAHIRADLKRPPALPNDKPVHMAGLDQAMHDLETLMIRTMTKDLDTLKDTRAGSIFTFREHIDYDARVATSPSIRTICEVGFYCGQSAVVFLEANPSAVLIGFDDFSYPAGEACYNYLLSRYRGRIIVHRGQSQDTIPAFIKRHTGADGVYNGPVCDIIRTDARPEYNLRRQDFAALQPMTSCSTLILFNDVCNVQNCHLYNVKNCYWQYGKCVEQNPLFFEGSAMVYEELIRRQVVDGLDTFYLGQNQPNFYKSWALGRMTCGTDGRPIPLPATPLFQNPEAFQKQMQTCYKQGGCDVAIT